jgi:hypothetical protein
MILSALVMETIRSYETSILTRATWRHISEDAILHSHLFENLKFYKRCRMASFGMLRSVALVRTDVPKELSASFIRVTRIGELGKKLAVTSKYFFAACVGC